MKPISVWRRIWVLSKAISKNTKNMFGIPNFSAKSVAVLRPRLKIYASRISCRNFYLGTRMNTDYRDVESDKKISANICENLCPDLFVKKKQSEASPPTCKPMKPSGWKRARRGCNACASESDIHNSPIVIRHSMKLSSYPPHHQL